MINRKFKEESSDLHLFLEGSVAWIRKSKASLENKNSGASAPVTTFPYVIEKIFLWSSICSSIWWLDSMGGNWSEEQQKLILFLFILPGSVASAWTIRKAIHWLIAR